MNVVNLQQKLSQFSDPWNPRIVGRLNGQLVKVAKLAGEFVWHHLMLFEPESTLNTGNVESERTVRELEEL